MNSPMRKVRNLLGIVSLLGCGLIAGRMTLAQSAAPAGKATPGADLLPRDQHEGMTISVDSYSDAKRSKEKFGKADPVPVGILPVDVFLKNATTQPIRIDMESVQLDVHFENGQHQDIDWLPVSEVARMIAHPKGAANPHARRFPIGVETGADTKTDKIIELLRPFALDVSIIPPMASLHGFLFFDLNHDLSLSNHASLYLPNLTNVPDKKPLMFFEVLLGKS
jgi:hypothetical protein